MAVPHTGGGESALAHRQPDREASGTPVGLSRFQDRRFNGYLGVRIPHELDTEVEAFVTAYVSGPQPLRRTVLDGVGRRAAAVLSAYGQRMASVAVRTRSPEPLRHGLVAAGLAEVRLEEPRNNLYVLAAINDSASLTGTSLQRLIAEVSPFLPPAGVAALRAFDRREDRHKSIESMGIRRTGSGETFRYR
ncbi:hypothetical protein ACFWPQ_41755 [Streptomyces sp. NPDC058464]|uniref:hypothetical protein n=1 Tax=Streptomyces sp. NPDC058464 TaxID=3346511 RepID=UPI00364E6174